ncbi:hypothetical protein Cni_G02349 [Canna indica]|uniref:Uncharacterized protein n=1 Tax=Canna indica TaxID=4628 RepID=A0AAQ3JP38_9LILI|nr:hypothetical protein Cni_G02349 [Canna indica]
MAIIPSSVEEINLQIEVLKICTGYKSDVEEEDDVTVVRHLTVARSEPQSSLDREDSEVEDGEIPGISTSKVRHQNMPKSIPFSLPQREDRTMTTDWTLKIIQESLILVVGTYIAPTKESDMDYHFMF